MKSLFVYLIFCWCVCSSCSPPTPNDKPKTSTKVTVQPSSKEEVNPKSDPETEEMSEEGIHKFYQRQRQALEHLNTLSKPNVMDYFLALPEHHFQVDLAETLDTRDRKSRITHINISDGYIRAEWDRDWEMVVTLFKDRQKGRDYLFLMGETENCGDFPAMPSIDILAVDETGNWASYLEELTQNIPHGKRIIRSQMVSFVMELPEKGTQIPIFSCTGGDSGPTEPIPYGQINWTGTEFLIEWNEAGKKEFAYLME